MLSTLLIRNLALIEELEVTFAPGLNIVTGETGAGKSIVIGAVQLLLGQRAERSAIRTGADACEVSGVFELASQPRLLAQVDALLAAAGVPACEEGQLLVRRWFSEKSARIHVNATAVTLAVLRDLGDLLVDVHGPYDHQSLLRPAPQLAVLDAYGEPGPELAAVAARFAALREVRERIAASEREGASPDLIELLRHQLREIEQAKLVVGEDEELVERHRRAANSSQLSELVAACRAQIGEAEGCVLDQLGTQLRAMQELERLDAEAGQRFVGLLEAASTELQSLVEELGEYAARLELDPRELQALDARVTLLHKLKRKYGGSVERVLAFAAEARERLGRLEHAETYREQLHAEEQQLLAKLTELARALGQRRRRQARKLAPLIAGKLRRLGFPAGEFEIALGEAPLGPTGLDSVEFRVAPNPGEGSAPLREIASSGEIARIMLAIKTVLAAADDVPLLIFDEVDANIGGVVAATVGDELRALARERQVLCITHLPQIAAGADRHFSVAKATRDGRTVADMRQLDDDGRIHEIARMLGGEASSSVVLKHAAELIAKGR